MSHTFRGDRPPEAKPLESDRIVTIGRRVGAKVLSALPERVTDSRAGQRGDTVTTEELSKTSRDIFRRRLS